MLKSLFTEKDRKKAPKEDYSGKVRELNQYKFNVNYRNGRIYDKIEHLISEIEKVCYEDEYFMLELKEENENCQDFFDVFLNLAYGTNDIEKVKEMMKKQRSTTETLFKNNRNRLKS